MEDDEVPYSELISLIAAIALSVIFGIWIGSSIQTKPEREIHSRTLYQVPEKHELNCRIHEFGFTCEAVKKETK